MIETTIFQQLEITSQQLPDKIAYIFPDENIKFTFSQVHSESMAIAKALISTGVKRGDNIGIWSVNCSKWVLLVFAAARIGATIIPINTYYHFEELEDVCKRGDIVLLFAMQQLVNAAPNLVTAQFLKEGKIDSSRYSLLKKVIALDENAGYHTSWEEFIRLGDKVTLEEYHVTQYPVGHDTHLIQFTSGTSAKPKGAMLTQYGVMNTAHAYTKLLHLKKEDVTCVPLPLFHCFGNILTLLGGLLSGSTTIYMKMFSTEKTLHVLETEKCTAFMGVPTMYLAMMNRLDFSKYKLDKLVKAGVGGAFCPEMLARRITDQFGIAGLVIGYGLSEAASLCTLADINAPFDVRMKTVGYPLPELEVSLADLQTGVHDSSLTEGEIIVRGFCVMTAYYKDKKATEEALDQEGWLHTGDIGRKCLDGAFEHVGRCKELIIRGGENISPCDIESVILQMEQVVDCQCIGVPDEKYGEEIAACVILANQQFLTEADILAFCKQRLASYKIPKYVLHMDKFPMNAAGKVLKSQMIVEVAEILKRRLGFDKE